MIARLLFVVVLGVCGRGAAQGAELAGKLVLSGSSTVAPLANELGKLFEAKHPGVRIDVQSGGSSRGVADARSGLADIGLVSRALKADESDLTAHTVALDGVGIILHKDNPVAALTDAQIVALYKGEVKTWQGVGGRDERVTVVSKAEGRSTLELFLAYFGLKASQVKASVVIGDNEQGIKTLAANPTAIGYVSIGSAEVAVSAGTPIKLLPVGGVVASTSTVQNRTFPLSRPLNFVTKGKVGALAQTFLDFACSDAAAEAVKRQHFVPPTAASKS
jgi:phosphate transport system substrate-binding protein